MIIKDNMANMCAKVTSTYMEFTLAFGPKPEFSFSFKLNVFGNTTCNKICDEVKVTLHLQRLEGNSWATIYTLGPKVAKNTNYVSNSKNYTIKGGYYYRIKGSHTAIKGSTAESTASYTDGLWIK